MISDGIKSANQVQFQNMEGKPTVPVIGENGGIVVEMADGQAVDVNRTSTTLFANVITVGAEEQTIGVNARVNFISIANYSEANDVSVGAAGKTFVVGAGLAVDLPINKSVDNVSISATGEGTKVQYVIKGVEVNG